VQSGQCVGEHLAGVGFSFGAGEPDGCGDTAGDGKFFVPDELVGKDGMRFGAEIELQEKLDLGVVFAPARLGVGANEVAEMPGPLRR
jgi:hypothetical protein